MTFAVMKLCSKMLSWIMGFKIPCRSVLVGERLPRVLHHGPVPADERVADPQRPGQRHHHHPEPGDLGDVHHPGAGLHLGGGRTLLRPRPRQSDARRSVCVCVHKHLTPAH